MKPKYDFELKHINASAVNLTLFVNFLPDQFENLATIVTSEICCSFCVTFLFGDWGGGPIYSLSI
jgi:hypothetical protein